MKRGFLMTTLVGAITLSGLVSACSSGTGDTATATSTSNGTSTSTDTTSAADATSPKVTNPLNASSFTSAPCNALNASDLPALHLAGATGSARTTAGAPVCAWHAVDTSDPAKSYHVNIGWLVPNATGLSSLYAQKTNQAYFNETTVDGYPAVFADLADLRSSGTCVINAAVSDSLYFNVRFNVVDQSLASQSCSLAQQAALDVIKNLGG